MIESTTFLDQLEKMDEYSEWYMYDTLRISMARIKLVGNAKYFQKTIVHDVDLKPPTNFIMRSNKRYTKKRICSSLLHG